jgi:hypothetical protein
MLTGLPDDLKRSTRERDGHRCLECGVAVATDPGCPQTQHVVPCAQGQSDDHEKPITLCFPCYATKGLRAHAEVLRLAVPDRLPEFVKQMTWDFGLNLLAYSAWIDPLRFDPAPVLEGFAVWQRYLETIAELARDAQAGDPIADC